MVEAILLGLGIAFTLAMYLEAPYSLYAMLYTWAHPRELAKAEAPRDFVRPRKSFTILLPARHEEDVIQKTIGRVVEAAERYDRELVEIIVICEVGDEKTIAAVQKTREALVAKGQLDVWLETFDDGPINKPHGLNVGLRRAFNDVVTIFDAEDEIHPDILNIVNTVMVKDNVAVVQAGVQLMNYDSSWYAGLNVLEYFFWFKSRLHFQARKGITPLGGNTVFFAREVLHQIGGWDEFDLTEDADMGIRISALRIPVRVIYDDRYVTKEETPPTLGHFIRQRTRWSQGFLHTVKKGTWRRLPTWQQQFMALHTLAFPAYQAVLALYLPLALWMAFFGKRPVVLSLFLISPIYFLLAQYVFSLVGLCEFAEAQHLRLKKTAVLKMTLGYLPYQWLLSCAALRALFRELRGINNWEKTQHTGAHRGGG